MSNYLLLISMYLFAFLAYQKSIIINHIKDRDFMMHVDSWLALLIIFTFGNYLYHIWL